MAVPMVSMPRAWSNKNKKERLRRDAFESAQRMLNRAVADTGVNFSIWSALRTHADQVAIFKANYTRVSRGRKLSTDRGYAGSIWARKSGGVSVASPDLGSNHQDGLAIDIHPAAIQNWIKANGLTYGWSWDEGRRVGESWHFRYIPSRDSMRSEGVLDHAAVQEAVGADVDGKIGTGTVAKIKAWQKKNGLTADGKVGSTTKRAMGLGKGDAPVVVHVPDKVSKPVVAASDYTFERHQTKNLRVDRIDEKRGLTGSLKAITIHHWGSDGQKFANVVSWLVADGNGNNQSSAHEVIEDGRVAILADAKDGTWNSGSSQGNLDNYALECRPDATAGDIATVAARVAAIRAEHGDLPIDVHADYVATACPGRYKDLLAEIDALARGGTVNLGRPVVVSKPKPNGLVEDGRWGTTTTKALQRFLNSRVKSRKLAIDGRMGPNAWRSLQEYLGHPVVDGLIEHQSYKPVELGNGISPNGWKYTGRNSKGSKTIKRLQRWIGVAQDGVVYEGTTKALQNKLNQHGMG